MGGDKRYSRIYLHHCMAISVLYWLHIAGILAMGLVHTPPHLKGAWSMNKQTLSDTLLYLFAEDELEVHTAHTRIKQLITDSNRTIRCDG